MKCKICQNEMKNLFSMGKQPLANKYPASTNFFENEIINEMLIYCCEECIYLHLPCDVNRNIFFEDYYYLSSVNLELVKHFEDLAIEIKALNPKLVLDVGSNDGILLKPLQENGITAIGIDPSENVSELANSKGLKTLVGFFNEEIISKIINNYGLVDVICASSVFTHFESPQEFFKTSKKILSKKGQLIIEIEYLADIIDSIGFERFYFDRPHYYSVNSIEVIAKKFGFYINKVKRLDAHNGSIRLFLSRESDESTGLNELISNEKIILKTSSIISKFHDFSNACDALKNFIKTENEKGKKTIGYGCPARFSTITNFANIGPDLLSKVIDDSPLKTNKFSPGMHIPIINYDESPDVDNYLVFAYEYIDTIKKKINKQCNFYKPLPLRKI